MATGSGNSTPRGSNRGGYKRKDCDKIIYRGDGGATSEKIRKDPKMAGTRLQMTKFGACGITGSMIRDAMMDVANMGHSMLSGDVVKLVSSIMDLDDTVPRPTQPSVIFSKGLHLLQGYNLNKEVVFDAVVSTPVIYEIDYELHKATLELPPLNPGANFKNPWNLPNFRFKVNFGIIRDMAFDGFEYRPLSPHTQEHTELVETEWRSTKDKHPSESLELNYIDPLFDENCYYMLTIGIEFGTIRNGGFKREKNASCGKILEVI